MRDRIWRSDGEGAIQHPRQKRDPVAPPSCVVLAEVTPYGGVAGMDLRHRRYHDDSDESTTDDEEKTDIVQCGQNSVSEDDDGAAGPGDDEEGDVDVPRLDDEVRVEESVHLDDDIGWDEHYGCEVEDPAEEIQGAGVETEDSTIAWSWCDGCPVVDASGGRYARGEL